MFVKNSNGSQRRRFLTHLGTTAVVGCAGLGSSLVFAAETMTKEQRDKLSPDDIIAMMKKGNERFLKGSEQPTHNYIAQQRSVANDQHPAAVILSCIDS